MSRILFCWELGQGFGHISQLALLGRALREAGHEVRFAVRDTETAGRALAPLGFADWLQAPVPRGRAAPPAASYSEMLGNVGFHDPAALRGRLAAWRSLFGTLQPDVIVFEHAPTALLAARGLELKRVLIGSGFSLPPAAAPMPVLRHFPAPGPERPARAEAAVLETINAALAADALPPLEAVAELFHADLQALFTLPELDHYPPREPAAYRGPLPPLRGGRRPEWPGGGRRVFAYLRPFAGLEALLGALHDSGAAVEACLPEAPPELLRRFHGGRLRLGTEPLDLGAAAAGCELAVSHGSLATVSSLLLAGRPQLILPLHLEMQITGRNLEQLGAGLSAPRLRPEGMSAKLGRLLAEPGFAAAARAFAARHAALHPEKLPARFAAEVATLA